MTLNLKMTAILQCVKRVLLLCGCAGLHAVAFGGVGLLLFDNQTAPRSSSSSSSSKAHSSVSFSTQYQDTALSCCGIASQAADQYANLHHYKQLPHSPHAVKCHMLILLLLLLLLLLLRHQVLWCPH
jgi:hypothetical protein